jgi:hypothetical protein
VEFLDGDLDRPIITGRVYNTAAHQNILDFRGEMPSMMLVLYRINGGAAIGTALAGEVTIARLPVSGAASGSRGVRQVEPQGELYIALPLGNTREIPGRYPELNCVAPLVFRAWVCMSR